MVEYCHNFCFCIDPTQLYAVSYSGPNFTQNFTMLHWKQNICTEEDERIQCQDECWRSDSFKWWSCRLQYMSLIPWRCSFGYMHVVCIRSVFKKDIKLMWRLCTVYTFVLKLIYSCPLKVISVSFMYICMSWTSDHDPHYMTHIINSIPYHCDWCTYNFSSYIDMHVSLNQCMGFWL